MNENGTACRHKRSGYMYKYIYYLVWYIYIERGEAKRARDIHQDIHITLNSVQNEIKGKNARKITPNNKPIDCFGKTRSKKNAQKLFGLMQTFDSTARTHHATALHHSRTIRKNVLKSWTFATTTLFVYFVYDIMVCATMLCVYVCKCGMCVHIVCTQTLKDGL